MCLSSAGKNTEHCTDQHSEKGSIYTTSWNERYLRVKRIEQINSENDGKILEQFEALNPTNNMKRFSIPFRVDLWAHVLHFYISFKGDIPNNLLYTVYRSVFMLCNITSC